MAIVQWIVFIDEADPDKIPHLVIKEGTRMRIPTKEEAERAVRIVNEDGNNIVRIFCRNPECADKGGWIERPRSGRLGVDKHVYTCETCHRPMVR